MINTTARPVTLFLIVFLTENIYIVYILVKGIEYTEKNPIHLWKNSIRCKKIQYICLYLKKYNIFNKTTIHSIKIIFFFFFRTFTGT